MEALKIKGIAREGVLSVRVPKEFEDKELEVIILSDEKNFEVSEGEKILTQKKEVKKFHEIPPAERLKILEQYKGTAKFPDFPINKYDVYDQ